MMNLNYVVVDVNAGFLSIYAFCDPENAAAEIAKAQKVAAKEAEHFSIMSVTPGDYFDEIAQKAKNAKYEFISYEEYERRQRQALLDDPVKEIDAETYEEMLDVLPPLYYVTINGVTMFCMSEMYTATYTTQYAKAGGHYYSAMVDAADKSTWIHNRLAK